METWAFFNEAGSELNRGWQGTEDQARALAQKFACEQGCPVEFISEKRLGLVRDTDPATEAPEGEWVEP